MFSTRYIVSRVLGAAVMAVVFFACNRAFGATTQTPDYSTITGQIAFAGVVYAILGVAGLLALAYAAYQGAQLVLSMIDPHAGGYWQIDEDGVEREYDRDGIIVGEFEDYE